MECKIRNLQRPSLTRAQADAVDALVNLYTTVDDEISDFGIEVLMREKKSGGWSNKEVNAAVGISDTDFIKSIIIGYDIKKTSEEKLLESYNGHIASFATGQGNTAYEMGLAIGIKEALQILGIEIEGINKPKEENDNAKTL